MRKLQSLTDLHQLQRHLRETAAAQAAAEAARREAERRAAAERNLFRNEVGFVYPLPDKRQATLPRVKPAPVAAQLALDEQSVLVEALSDGFDAATLLDTDDTLSYRRTGIGVDVVQRLRRGEWSIQRHIDLHGMRSADARDALSGFIRDAYKHGVRCVRVVHGKGLGSPGKTPVLKSRARNWLIQKKEVLAFVQARPLDGGAGALVVLLGSQRRRQLPAA